MEELKMFQQTCRRYFAVRYIADDEFLGLAQWGVDLAQPLSVGRQFIAQLLVSAGAYLSQVDANPKAGIRQLANRFADLELPDAHVDISSGLSVGEQWDETRELIQKVACGE